MNIDACVIGVTMARQSVVNDVEDLGCVQQKQYWAQNTALWNAAEDIRDGGLIFVDEDYLKDCKSHCFITYHKKAK